MAERRKASWLRARAATLQRDGHTCRRCGATKHTVTLHVHHVLPRSEGGLTTLDNLLTLSEQCHPIVEHERPGYLERKRCDKRSSPRGKSWQVVKDPASRKPSRLSADIRASLPEWVDPDDGKGLARLAHPARRVQVLSHCGELKLLVAFTACDRWRSVPIGAKRQADRSVCETWPGWAGPAHDSPAQPTRPSRLLDKHNRVSNSCESR
jgi:hypothetical protein